MKEKISAMPYLIWTLIFTLIPLIWLYILRLLIKAANLP